MRAPCPAKLQRRLFGLLCFAITRPEFGNLRVSQVENLGSQEEITLVEAVGTLPFAFGVLITPLNGDRVERRTLCVLVPPNCGRHRMEVDSRRGLFAARSRDRIRLRPERGIASADWGCG